MTLNLGPERLPTDIQGAPSGRFARRSRKPAKPGSKTDPDALLKAGVLVPTDEEE